MIFIGMRRFLRERFRSTRNPRTCLTKCAVPDCASSTVPPTDRNYAWLPATWRPKSHGTPFWSTSHTVPTNEMLDIILEKCRSREEDLTIPQQPRHQWTWERTDQEMAHRQQLPKLGTYCQSEYQAVEE